MSMPADEHTDEHAAGCDGIRADGRTPLISMRHAAKELFIQGGTPMRIIHDTTLDIARGERIAIVGPSGSGKSTLLAMLGLLDLPTCGDILFDGHGTTTMGGRERGMIRAAHIGFVFQQFHLIATMSALENVMVGLQYTATPRGRRRGLAAEALERVGLGERLRHRPAQLSGGEQQRVAIARALVKRPDIIFADEPTGALDTETGRTIIRLLQEAGDRGAALVVVTHDPRVAARFPRRLHIRDGRVTQERAGAADSRTEGGSV